MKPTPTLHSNLRPLRVRPSFPLTDYSFQSTVETVARPSAISEKGISELRSFRKISCDFLNVEASRNYIVETILFACVSIIAAWPIAIAIHQLTRWTI